MDVLMKPRPRQVAQTSAAPRAPAPAPKKKAPKK
jgi:hypothetical protein